MTTLNNEKRCCAGCVERFTEGNESGASTNSHCKFNYDHPCHAEKRCCLCRDSEYVALECGCQCPCHTEKDCGCLECKEWRQQHPEKPIQKERRCPECGMRFSHGAGCSLAEKPVQEKASFGTSGNDMGYPTVVFSATADDAGGWREEFEKMPWLRNGFIDFEMLKSFISSLLQREREGWERHPVGALCVCDSCVEYTVAERSRILEEVEKLRKENCYSKKKATHACDSVCEAMQTLMHIIKGEDVKK